MFYELLGRSCFSFLDGASHPAELLQQAQKLQLTGLALCDSGGLYGSVRAHAALLELRQQAGGQLPRLAVGAELELGPGWAGFRLALLVQNREGYTRLCTLLRLAHAEAEKGCHRLKIRDLRGRTEGLLFLLVPPARPQSAPAEQVQELDLLLAELPRLREQVRVVVYRHLDPWDEARERLSLALAERLGLSLVASARPYFHEARRQPLYDVLSCIRRGCRLDEAGAALSANGQACLQSEAALRRRFADHPEWIEESVSLGQSLQFSLEQVQYHFPCQLPPGKTADQQLEDLSWKGVENRYPRGCQPAVRAQIRKELDLIAKLHLAPYFLSTLEIVEMARERGILCQGRGSAANSAVCYVLGITAVDPERSQLLFERFLSEERAEPPDIDIDFEHERREEVISAIYARYGRQGAAMVSEVIRFRGKSALREVGKVFGLSLAQVSSLSQVAETYGDATVADERLLEAGFDPRDGRLRQVLSLAQSLCGFPRHLSIHVGGFVLSSRPLDEIAPVEPARMPGRSVLPWDKDDIETLGFFKVDVLALGMLTAIRRCLALLYENGQLLPREPPAPKDEQSPQEELKAKEAQTPELAPAHQELMERREPALPPKQAFDPLQAITWIEAEDPLTYEAISRADTVGVFQIESRAQMAMLPRLRPRCFYDLVIEVALVRPGPIQGKMVHPYLRRRSGLEAPRSPHPDLEPILARTLGVPLFQEQVMQLAIEGAGYTGGQADQLRRDMAAWKKSGRLEQHRERLLQGFAKKGISPQFAEDLFQQIQGFGEYGFPESHAASFALLVYSSAWLKTHFPAAFTCALLNSQPLGFYSPRILIRDAQKHGVLVRDVCVLESDWDCRLERAADGKTWSIRLGLRFIQGLSRKGGEGILRARRAYAEQGAALDAARNDSKVQDNSAPDISAPTDSERDNSAQADSVQRPELQSFVRQAGLAAQEARILSEAGAFAALCGERRQALLQLSAPRSEGLYAAQRIETLQVKLPALSGAAQLALDYEHKGLSLEDHPLRYYRASLQRQGAKRAEDLSYLPHGSQVCVGGLVQSRQRPMTASGILFITLEDETGSVNLIVRDAVYQMHHHLVRHSPLLVAYGRLERMPLPGISRSEQERRARELQAEVGRASLPEPKGQPLAPVHLIVERFSSLERLKRAPELAKSLAVPTQASNNTASNRATVSNRAAAPERGPAPELLRRLSRDFH